MEFDKWYELRQFLNVGIEYAELPDEQRKAYAITLGKMKELEETEVRFNQTSPNDPE